MRQLKNSFYLLLAFLGVYAILQFFFGAWFLTHGTVYLLFGLLFLWFPGSIALVFAKKEGIALSVFKGPWRAYFRIAAWSFSICTLGYLIGIPFGILTFTKSVFAQHSFLEWAGLALLQFFVNFLLISTLFSGLLLGGELYWRGYLWEKLKKGSIGRVFVLVSLAWFLWQMPLSYLSVGSMAGQIYYIPVSLLFSFLVSPYLLYWRMRVGSVLAASVAYGTLMGGILFFLSLFPPTALKALYPFGIGIAIALFAASLILKIYHKETWTRYES